MSLTDPIDLFLTGGTVHQLYNTISSDGMSTLRRAAGRELHLPRTLFIGHQVVKKTGRTDSVVKFATTEIAPDDVTLGNLVAQLTIRRDVNAAITAATFTEMWYQITQIMALSGFAAAIQDLQS